MKKNNMISDTVKKWAEGLERAVSDNKFTVPVYPAYFTSEEEEKVGRTVKYQTIDC